MEEIEIIDTNPDNICDCGFCGIKNTKQEGYKRKADWLKTCKDAQNAPSAYGTFSIIYNGKLLADHPISNRRFMNIMNKETK